LATALAPHPPPLGIAALVSLLISFGWRRVWSIDFEFRPHPTRPWGYEVVCMVAHDIISGQVIELWLDGVENPECPFSMAKDEMFIAYSAIAEATSFLSLGWPRPIRMLDLMVELVCATNGLGKLISDEFEVDPDDPKQRRQPTELREPELLTALAFFGLPAISMEDKDRYRQLVLRGGPYTEEEKRLIIAYCNSDVDAGTALLLPLISFAGLSSARRIRQAIWRGRSVSALAVIEAIGNPFDMPLVKRFLRHWEAIRHGMITELGADYPGCFTDADEFSEQGFAQYLIDKGIPWPRTKKTGKLLLNKKQAKKHLDYYPELKMLFDLRDMLNKASGGVGEFNYGSDGRGRARLRPFCSKTGRNQPSSRGYVYGATSWMRFLLRAPPGRALIHLDYATQEIGILAALSGDKALWKTYRTGRTYCILAGDAGVAPPGATKATHPEAHAFGKTLGLGLQYGMSGYGAARLLKVSQARADQLLNQQRERYAIAWAWSSLQMNKACQAMPLETCGGWRMHWAPGSQIVPNPRTARNWMMQSHGAEILRYLAIRLVEAGFAVCGLIHDAVVVECDARNAKSVAAKVKAIMIEASRAVIGKPLLVDFEIFAHPRHYSADKGRAMFETAMRYLELAEREEDDRCASGLTTETPETGPKSGSEAA
jgi:hypothetical protein